MSCRVCVTPRAGCRVCVTPRAGAIPAVAEAQLRREGAELACAGHPSAACDAEAAAVNAAIAKGSASIVAAGGAVRAAVGLGAELGDEKFEAAVGLGAELGDEKFDDVSEDSGEARTSRASCFPSPLPVE